MILEKLYELKYWDEVSHTTLNPNGPGAVRIHLVPPKFFWHKNVPSVCILNGNYILPLGESQAILLTEFIRHVNEFGEGAMSDEQLKEILEDTYSCVRKVYPRVPKDIIVADLDELVGVIEDVALTGYTDADIPLMSIGEYAPYMLAPHRMDLMVSAMTKDGRWNCNQKCSYCYAAGQLASSQEELSTDDWKEIIDDCYDAGIPQLTFTGGEPTMRQDLFELIAYARWFVTRLNTNGINLTPDYCKGLRKTDLDNVQITFYSYEKSIHESLTGVSCFEKTVDGIKNAINAGLSVSINTPLCSLNSDYVKTLQFLHELGVIYVTCSGMIPSGNAIRQDQQDDQLTKEELTSILQKAVDYCRDNDMEIQFTSPGQVLEDDLRKIGLNVPSCGACLSNMAVTPGGKVVSCQSALSSPVLGDMLEDPWDKIWNSRRCRAIRNESAKMMQKCPLQEVNSIEL